MTKEARSVPLWSLLVMLRCRWCTHHRGVSVYRAMGCIFGELVNHKPLFPGKTELEQLELMFKLLGELRVTHTVNVDGSTGRLTLMYCACRYPHSEDCPNQRMEVV